MTWNAKANVRGPAGYNATGAVEDIATLAAYARQSAGPNAFGSAMEAIVDADLTAKMKMVPLTVRHDYDAYYPRPAHPGAVIWQGMVPPRNRLPGDTYYVLDDSPESWPVESLNLVAWHDASLYGGTGPVYSIADLSGFGNHLDIAGGTGAVELEQAAIHGRPAFKFPGTALLKSVAYGPNVDVASPLTVFIVVQVPTAATTQTFFDSAVAGIRTGIFRSGTGTGSDTANCWGITQGSAAYSAKGTVTDAPVLLAATFTREGSGTLDTRSARVINGENMGAGWLRQHQLGAAAGAQNYFTGRIGEVIVATGVTAAQRASAMDYLASKWGV